MFALNNNQYFLVINQLNLFPEITPKTIPMLEQVFNAILLQSTNNIQLGIDNILNLEYFCKTMLNDNYLDVLKKIEPTLHHHGIYVVQGEQIRGYYAGYGDSDKHYRDIGKQHPMNVEFALSKKISYNGKSIIWENTYVDWLNKLMMEREQKTNHQPDDHFITNTLFQKVQDLHWSIKHTIKAETTKYVNKYKKSIAS